MALSVIERDQYPHDFSEMKQYVKLPYMKPVLDILGWEDIEVNRKMIYNTVRGHRKDYEILNALRSHIGLKVNMPGKLKAGGLKSLVKRQKLRMPKPDSKRQ